MKKRTLVPYLAAATLAFGFAACDDSGENTAATDSTDAIMPDNTATTMATSSSNYAAMADTVRTNSEAGNYLDARTGKTIKIHVDSTTGMRINDETNEPVWRYVDKRTYWVYGNDNNNAMWDTVGTARMQNNNMEYRDNHNNWVNYDKQWKEKDDMMGNDWKMKNGDTKMKMSKDGDGKDENGKMKYDADDNKIKTKGDMKMSADSAH